MMTRSRLNILLATVALSGLAACASGGGDRVPLLVSDRIYVVTADDRHPVDVIVTGPAGAGLTRADGRGADRAFAEFCRTQGHEGGTSGSFIASGPLGYWRYGACRS